MYISSKVYVAYGIKLSFYTLELRPNQDSYFDSFLVTKFHVVPTYIFIYLKYNVVFYADLDRRTKYLFIH